MNGRHACILIPALAMTVAVHPSAGQPRPRPAPVSTMPPVLIEPSAPTANLFARAEGGIARRDWKFAIDCLQRIIDDPQDSLVRRPSAPGEASSLYESARRKATRSLAALPPEGLRAYRLLFDGRAKRLYQRGRSQGDSSALRTVVDRYLLTHFGDDAADLLASRALDAGQANEVITVLTDLLELVPDSDVPDRLVATKLAAAYAMAGYRDEAALVLQSLSERGDGGVAGDDLPSLESIISLQVPLLTRPDGIVNWPLEGGTPARSGLMAAVEPTLFDDVPWRYTLPDAKGHAWRRVLGHHSAQPLVLPVRRLVSDGRRIFARIRGGCVALRIDDLSLVWDSAQIGNGAVNSPAPSRARGGSRTSSSSVGAMVFDDYVAGGISLGHGLALAVSRAGRGTYQPSLDGLERSDAALLPGARGRSLRGTRLMAYDAKTGVVRWGRGRTSDPRDPLGVVEFRSVPLAVGDGLYLLARINNDLFLTVLDPADGSLVRNVLLCSIGQPSPHDIALNPASAEGLIYVPTAHGVLFAVDLQTLTVRWANQYNPSGLALSSPDDLERHAWLPSAPVVVGGNVLLAPGDGGELMCFSATNGELRWSAPVCDSSYLIGADRDHAWVGGRSVSCLSLTDGDVIWTTELPAAPTGRAVRSACVIHAPTTEGLVTLDAADGELVGRLALDSSDGPLGNLLCLNHALYSLNPYNARKFPDIGRSYPVAAEKYQANPTDVDASLELAWLEFLQNKPQEAYEVLESISRVGQVPSDRRANDVAHLMVETLLALAATAMDTGDGGTRVLALLEEADGTARTPSDRVRCGLALADEFRRVGRFAKAYRQLWKLGTSADAEQLVSLGDHVEGLSRFDIARRLEHVAADLSTPQRGLIERELQSETDRLVERLAGDQRSGQEARTLRAIVDLAPFGNAARGALAGLISYHNGRGHFEQAEQLLAERLRFDGESDRAIGPMMELCSIYRELVSLDRGATPALLRHVQRLGSGHESTPLPDAVRLADWFTGPERDVDTVGEWIELLRSGLPQDVSAEPIPRSTARSVQLTGEVVWNREWSPQVRGPQRIRFGEHRPPLLAERFLLYEPGEQVSCYDASDGKTPVWQTTLRLPQSFTEEQPASRRRNTKQAHHQAVAEGQTAVFAGRTGLFAVGLATGRRIWARAYDPAGDAAAPLTRSMPLAVRDGLLAATPRAGRLTLLRMLDGATVWEHELRGEDVAHIWMGSGSVVTADSRLERVLVLDRATGKRVSRRFFSQPRREDARINLIRTGPVLCGPVSTRDLTGIVGMDIDSGEIVWEVELELDRLVQLFKPAEGFLGVGVLEGEVLILDAATGDKLFDQRIPGVHAVTSGALVDGTFVLTRVGPQKRQDPTFAAFDVVTGEELWRREDAFTLSDGQVPLRVAAGCVAAAVVADENRRRGARKARFALLDVRTGLAAGVLVPFPSTNRTKRFRAEFDLFPASQIALVRTKNKLVALRMESTAQAGERGF